MRTNILPFEIRRDKVCANIIKCAFITTESPLKNIIQDLYKKDFKALKKNTNCVLARAIEILRVWNINISITKTPLPSNTSWYIPEHSIIKSMSTIKKHETSNTVYQSLFLEIKNKFKDHTFIYTDASKINNNTSFSITLENSIIMKSYLPPYSSIFTGEITAIHEAIKFAKQKAGKFAICTDSMGAISAISNHTSQISTYYPQTIRELITKLFPKIIIIWVPSHVQIPGNEFADKAAKYAAQAPLALTNNQNYNDIKAFIKSKSFEMLDLDWNKCSTWYKKTNPNRSNAKNLKNNCSDNLTRLDMIKIFRLRFGHTKLTHQYIFDGSSPPCCHFCGGIEMSIHHILVECCSFDHARRLFNYVSPIDFLSNPPNTDNNNKIIKFLKMTKLYHLV